MSSDVRDYEWIMGFLCAVIDDIRAGRTIGATGSSVNVLGYMTDATTFGSGVIARINRGQNDLDVREGLSAIVRGDL